MANDDCIVVAGGNSAAELLTVSWFKVFLCGSEDICRGIQAQELGSPLLCQMVGHNEKGLLTQAKPLAFHGSGHHLESFSRTNLVRKERIAAVENVRHSVELMLTELNFRVHTTESDVTSIVFTGTIRIEELVIASHKLLPSVGISPNPILERILNGLLLLLGKGCLLGVEDTAFLAIRVCDSIIDTHIAEIQRIFQNLIGVGSVGAIGHIGVDIAVGWLRLAGDVPFRRERRIVHLNGAAQIVRRVKGFLHKLLDVVLVDPRCTKAYFNLGSVQILWLSLLQGCYIHPVISKIFFRKTRCSVFSCNTKLFSDVAGKVFICCLPLPFNRVKEDNTSQI